MKKILFVMPCIITGGTYTVLQQVLAKMKDKYDIGIYIIYDQIGSNYQPIEKYIIDNKSFMLNHRNNKKNFFHTLMSKVWLKFDLATDFKYSKHLFKKEAKRLSNKYDVVIGFEEGITTLFASYIDAPKKLAWIHCDYKRYRDINGGVEESAIYSAFDKIVCVAENPRKNFAEIYPALEDKTVTLYNLLDIDSVLTKAEEPIDDIEFDNRYKICSIGRFDKVKQFDLIPSIVSNMKAKNKDFVWYIMGDYNNLYGNLVKSKIEEYGVEDNIVLMGAKRNPYKYLNKCDLLVSTSSSEACPMVIKEATLLNKYVVANNFQSAHEVLDNEHGTICDIDSMADVILDVMNRTDTIIDENIKDYFNESNEEILAKLYQLINE